MNAVHPDTAAVTNRGDLITDTSKRLLGWGSPIVVKDLERLQKRYDELRSLPSLHSALRTASWFHRREKNPLMVDGNVDCVLYLYNLPCGAKLAISVPKAIGTGGKIAAYMTNAASVQDHAKIQCDFIMDEINRSMAV